MDKLADLRQKIDIIDYKIIDALAERMEISRCMGNYKALNNIEIFQPQRFENMMKQRVEYADKKHITKDFIDKIFDVIHEASKQEQFNIITQKKDE